MVPVHADDFKKLNEFAESAWVMREVTADPRNADRIKENIKENFYFSRENGLSKLIFDLNLTVVILYSCNI